MKHKLIKGYLVGKAIEMTIAGATVLLANIYRWRFNRKSNDLPSTWSRRTWCTL